MERTLERDRKAQPEPRRDDGRERPRLGGATDSQRPQREAYDEDDLEMVEVQENRCVPDTHPDGPGVGGD